MTNRYYLLLTFFLMILLGVLDFFISPDSADANYGTILFSHAIHKPLAECSTCHPAGTSESAEDNLIPTPDACVSCHDPADVRTYWNLPADEPLDRYYVVGKNRNLIYSHKYHTELSAMTCEVCHADVLEDKSGIPGMDACFQCHNDASPSQAEREPISLEGKKYIATKACEACHTILAGLKPQNHLSLTFVRFHGKTAIDQGVEGDCALCHSSGFCQGCHSPTNNAPHIASANRFYLNSWTRGEKIDDGKLITVQNVHSLTYRYTHGFDARAQTSRCQTCHERESFCTPCHRNGYDATGTKIIPQSHQLAGFATVGGGKALNRHAKLAKMDMESCVTCHDMNGADPNCAICHSSGVIKGGE